MFFFPGVYLLVFVAALTIATLPFGVEGLLVASSSIQYCERGSGENLVPCEKKMVVTLSVDSAQDAGVEDVVLVRDAVDETRGPGNERVKFEPIRLSTKKTRVQYQYPVFYERNFNAKPYEEQVTKGLIGCRDSLSEDSTCGIVRDENGKPIVYSQGFCCNCGACQLAGLCPPGTRGINSCNLFGDAAMASCLRFGELWYSGYSFGTVTAWYRLEVKLSYDSSDSHKKAKETVFDLGPDVLSASSKEFGAWARLVGDFMPSEPPLDLTTKMIFVPSSPKGNERVLAGSKEWIILDKRLVSIQGRECNRVGVSYEGFSAQGNRCEVEPGTCLADQLEDYRASDLATEAKGGKGKYMARFLGDFDSTTSNSTDAPIVSYWMRGSLATMVTVVVSADRLRYILSVSPGKIISTKVSKSEIAVGSRDGSLSVTVCNTGSIKAQYTLGVGNCSSNVFPMMAQSITMAPQETLTRSFDLNVQSALNQIVRCDVALHDARGSVADKKVVEFKVTSSEWTDGTQGHNSGTGGGTSVNTRSNSKCKECGWYNIICFLFNKCAWQPLMYALIAVGVVMLIFFIIKCLLRRGFRQKRHIAVSEPVCVPQPIVVPQTVLPYGNMTQASPLYW